MTFALLVASLAFAQDPAPAQVSPFARGNALYAQGNYEGARQQYLAQLQQGPVTVPLLYNLGNACFQARQLGWAIVYYERALLAAPRDADLRANHALAMSSRHVAPSTTAPGWAQVLWRAALDRATLSELSLLMLAAYLLASVLVIRWLRGTLFRRRYQWLLWLSLVLLLLFGSLTAGRARAYHDSARAVIVADGQLMSGPAGSFQTMRKTYQGEFVRLVGQQGMWREVIFESGARGFVAQTEVEPIAVRAP
ncbi:MAG: tetratricopeptide repeat protein [Armatimonadota bacterium]